jgi:hypothetical protein
VGLLGKVQDDDRLPATGTRCHRLTEGFDVEAAAGVEGREDGQLAAVTDAELQLVVLPEHVGQQHHVASVDEQVADQAERMGHAAGDDRRGKTARFKLGFFSIRCFRQACRRSGRPRAGA